MKEAKEGSKRGVEIQKTGSFPFGLRGEDAQSKLTTHREFRRSMVFNTEARRHRGTEKDNGGGHRGLDAVRVRC